MRSGRPCHGACRAMTGFMRAPLPMPKFAPYTVVALVALGCLAGCKILPTPTEEDKAAAAAQEFNPDKMVEEIWAPKVLPYLEGKAGPFQEVRQLAGSDAK